MSLRDSFYLKMNEPCAQGHTLWLKASTKEEKPTCYPKGMFDSPGFYTAQEDSFTINIDEAIPFPSREWAEIGQQFVASWDFVKIVKVLEFERR